MARKKNQAAAAKKSLSDERTMASKRYYIHLSMEGKKGFLL